MSIFKPLKGRDTETRRCLESWFRQDYPHGFELLLGVDGEDDPVCELVNELIRAHPTVAARLVVRSSHRHANGKVAKLIEMSRHAQNDVWVVCDADVTAPPDLLQQTVGLLQQEGSALVHCLYRLEGPSTSPVQWEAIGVNVDFWSQVLQARQLRPLDFALGAAMITTRRRVEEIGGFASLGNYLADDYHLGHQLARRGHRLSLSQVVVTCHEPSLSWSQVWKHQLRWARTIRSCKPLPYFFSILNNPTLWPVLFAILAATSGWGAPWGIPLLLFSLLLRLVLGVLLYRRFTGKPLPVRWWGMLFVKDLLQVVLWGMAFVGNVIDWRGEEFRVQPDGKMVANPRPRLKVESGIPACFDSSTQPEKRS